MVPGVPTAGGPSQSDTPGNEAYLEAIYVLTVEGRRVSSAKVAQYLSVTPVSVSRALSRLDRAGALAARTPEIRLTDDGWLRAAAVVRRHRLAERWLAERLGLDLVASHQEAERIEHAISRRVEEALWLHLDRPATCPHGNPIPDEAGRVPPLAEAEPLCRVGPGAFVVDRIFEQIEGLEPLLGFVGANGLVPGTRLEVVTPGPAPAVTVSGAEVTVPPEVAECLLVRPAPA